MKLRQFVKRPRSIPCSNTLLLIENSGSAPRYLVIDFSKAEDCAVAKDEDVLEISKRLLAQNKEAYEVLAK